MHSSGSFHAVIRNRNHDRHLQHELKQVGPQYAPEPAERNIKSRERNQKENANRQARGLTLAQRGAHDARHRLGHPAQDQTIHQQTQIDRAKSTQKRRGLSGVAHFGKLHIGEQTRTPPQPGKQEHGHHSRRQKAPPEPVPRYALRVDQTRHHQRRIRRKRRGDHRRPCQPPRDLSPRYKIILRAPARTPPEIDSEQHHQQEVSGDHGPIESASASSISSRSARSVPPEEPGA